jgi:hypothetical protein
MHVLKALASGSVGAFVLTLVHEVTRRVLPEAPRLDILGMRAIAASLRTVGEQPPPEDELFGWAMVGDLAANSVYYSAVGVGSPEGIERRGLLLGLGAGIGAVVVPPLLRLGTRPQARTPVTLVLTVLWYLIGGLVAAAVARRLSNAE